MATWFKRFFLFFFVNFLVVTGLSLVLGIICLVFHVDVQNGLPLIVVYSIFGMGGAFINLALSRTFAKSMLGVQLIDPSRATGSERELVDLVYRLAQKAGLPTMPEVGIYDSAEVNAFATGPSKARSLVAISTGLIERMDRDAVEGVLGHEVTHIANGDMVTMTLIQGLVNTMVLFVARILANIIANQMDERSGPAMRFAIYMGLQIVLNLFGTVVVCYFSRRREYRADAGGARLAGPSKMLSGLNSLRSVYGVVDNQTAQNLATLKISGHASGLFTSLFATHPPLEDRIRRLESLR